jgi:hypothetical protein
MSPDPGEIEGYRKTWFGAYEKVDPNAPEFYEAIRLHSEKMKKEQEAKQKGATAE